MALNLGEICFNHRRLCRNSFHRFNGCIQYISGNISEKILGNTDPIRELLVKPAERILYLFTGKLTWMWSLLHLARGAFEYQGQKCSAASRAYLPSNLAARIKEKLVAVLQSMKVGTVEDFRNFINAVIDEKSFDKIKGYIDRAADDPKAKIIAGGKG